MGYRLSAISLSSSMSNFLNFRGTRFPTSRPPASDSPHRLAVSPRLPREPVATWIASVVDAVVHRRLIDSVTPGEVAWGTALPDFLFRDALIFRGLGNPFAVAGQVLGQKETVDRGLPPGAADAVGGIERIEPRLGLRDVGAAIAVAVDTTAGAGRVDRALGGDPDRHAGWVPGVEVAPEAVPGIAQRWIETGLVRGVCRRTLGERTPRDQEGRRLMTGVANGDWFRQQGQLTVGDVDDVARGRLELDRALRRQQERGRCAGRRLCGVGWIEDASHQLEAERSTARRRERFADEHSSR